MRGFRGLDTAIRTVLALTVVPVGIALCSLWAIALALVSRSNREVHRAYLAFGRMCLFVIGTDLRVHGADHAQRGRGYVVVSNHESNWDPPSVISALPDLVLRFVTKIQVMRIPIFGSALRLTGNVTVHRNRSAGDAGRIRSGIRALDPEVSLYFFAEGSRSRSGEMQPFKRGAFITALEHGLPILPIGIAGTRAVWAPKGLIFRKAAVVIEVGEPIPVDGLGPADRDRLRDQTQEVVAKLRALAYQRLRA